MITGSTYSVNNMHPHMRKVASHLKDALAINKQLKMVGFCFGHQLLANIHGARVEKR